MELVLELAMLSSLDHYQCGSTLNFLHYSQQPVIVRALARARLGPASKMLEGVATSYLASSLTASSGCWIEIWLARSRFEYQTTIIRVLRMR